MITASVLKALKVEQNYNLKNPADTKTDYIHQPYHLGPKWHGNNFLKKIMQITNVNTVEYLELPRDKQKSSRWWMFTISKRKFKSLAFYKALGKLNTVFTFAMTLLSLKGNRREKIYRYVYSHCCFIFD